LKSKRNFYKNQFFFHVPTQSLILKKCHDFNGAIFMDDDAEHLREHWKQHWKMTIIGSSVGLSAIIVNFIYLVLTNRFPSFLEGEIFEFVIFSIPVLVFLWFLRVALWESREIQESEAKRKRNLSKQRQNISG
jgi:hypothetical protein